MNKEQKIVIDKRFKQGRHFTYLEDPGHGYLIITHAELLFFGLAYKISPYSYMDETFVYLEEDLDAVLFFKAFKARYGFFEYTTKHVNHAHCRDKEGYDPTKVTLKELENVNN